MSNTPNARYAAFAKKHGLAVAGEESSSSSQNRTKALQYDVTNNETLFGAEGRSESFLPKALVSPIAPPRTTTGATTPSTGVNRKKRPATPEHTGLPSDIGRSESPLKTSRRSRPKVSAGNERPRKLVPNADFLAIAGVTRDSPAGQSLMNLILGSANVVRADPEAKEEEESQVLSRAPKRRNAPIQPDLEAVAALLDRHKLTNELAPSRRRRKRPQAVEDIVSEPVRERKVDLEPQKFEFKKVEPEEVGPGEVEHEEVEHEEVEHEEVELEKVELEKIGLDDIESEMVKPEKMLPQVELLQTQADDDGDFDKPQNTGLIPQPDSRPITQEQLAAEVKAIYAGLIKVEAKCVDLVTTFLANLTKGKNSHQLDFTLLQDMIVSHKSLLHEHHDFLLASQHPLASLPLKALAMKYSMPARMWKHGIHNFLELLRRCLPLSLDFMLQFIYLAYQMIALLYETVPSFENTWIECLGDLSRYRMAIEDEDQGDRDTWSGVARFWYSKAADKSPGIGRLYHHLAILARSQALQQLSLYCRSLTSLQIFSSAQESIMTLFEPMLNRPTTAGSRPLSVDSWFIRCHALMFTSSSFSSINNAALQSINIAAKNFLEQLAVHISRLESRWRLQGVYVAIANIASLLMYGSTTSTLRTAFDNNDSSQIPPPPPPPVPVSSSWNPTVLWKAATPIEPTPQTKHASSECWNLTFMTFSITLSLPFARRQDALPHIHVTLAFIWRATLHTSVADKFVNTPWKDISALLNDLRPADKSRNLFLDTSFQAFSSLKTEKSDKTKPLPEDFVIRGLVWSADYFPTDWFANDAEGSDLEERVRETPVKEEMRRDRVLWLGGRIAACGKWLDYDYETKSFSVHDPARPKQQPPSLEEVVTAPPPLPEVVPLPVSTPIPVRLPRKEFDIRRTRIEDLNMEYL